MRLAASPALSVALALALLAPSPAARADGERLGEVASAGRGLFARRDDGVVVVWGRYSVNGLSVSPFEIPRESSPLVTDADSAFALALPRGERTQPLLIQLRLEPSREKIKHALPGGFTAPPVAADERFVYFANGDRFDREAKRVVSDVEDELTASPEVGLRDVVSASTLGVFCPRLETCVATTTYLLRSRPQLGPVTWSVARRDEAGLRIVDLPPAASARLLDADAERIVIILDDERIVVLSGTDLTTLETIQETDIEDAPVRSVHFDRSGAWLVVGATSTCPAALLRRETDGRTSRRLTLPDDVRVVAASHEHLALAAPDSPAHRLVLVSRWLDSRYEVKTVRLRDDADRFLHGLKWTPAMLGLGMVAVPALMVAASVDELPTTDMSKAERKRLEKRAKARAKALPRVQECLGPLPDPGPCEVAW